MAQLYSYKPVNKGRISRGYRNQLIEDSFAKGMYYTNAPLMDGYAKVMVNYDLQDSGEALVPRPGLKSTAVFQMPAEGTSGYETIIANKEQHVDADTTVGQLITIAPVAEQEYYNLRVVTQGSLSAVQPVGGVPHYDYAVSDPVQVDVTTPAEAEIHGIPVNNDTIVKIPGTYAWNEQYYFLGRDTYMHNTKWDSATNKFIVETQGPKTLDAKQAATYGYNMLHLTPYTFYDTIMASTQLNPITLDGMMPYDGDEVCLTPQVNQDLKFRTYFSAVSGKKYKITYEWRGVNDASWVGLQSGDCTIAEGVEISCSFSPPADNIIIRVTAYGYTDDVVDTVAEAVLAVGFNFAKDQYGSTANVAPKVYHVYNATGLCYWKNRLIAWGVPEDPSILFSSDINDPTYFPFPQGADTFDEPIKFAMPFGDNLLVYTSTKLYMLTLDGTGLSWTKKLIQSNLTIADWDVHLTQTVKNMVFFRSGNYYYMMVPKATSTTGELTLAAISKPLNYMFDNFEKAVKQIISAVYDKEVTFTLKQYFNYLDFEDIHNVYVLQTDENELLNFDLLYNTVSRVWRIYITGSPDVMKPYKLNMTQKGALMLPVATTDSVYYQIMQYNVNDNVDSYVYTNYSTYHVWNAWQYLDTGYREHNSNFKKRYRELQFVINNLSNKSLNFYTDFFIDGEQRRSHYTYEVVQETDPEDPDYGLMTVEKVFNAPITAPGATALGESSTDTEAWTLDVSEFPDTSFWKSRFPVSGKGYVPRMVFVSRNELPYELLNISWVYRQLYSR